MQQLTPEGQNLVNDVALRHGFSIDAVTTMLLAVSAGYGNQAQFNHPEFGGMGQWSSGGMTMIGDMFNNYLKGRVASLCQELSRLVQGQPMFMMPAQSQNQSQGGGWQGQQSGGFQQQGSGGQQQQSGGGQQQSSGQFYNGGSSIFVPNSASGNWWPADLGMAASTGAQNNMRYAYFPELRRLAIDLGGQVSVYDTGNHQIGGFSQQQSGDQSITFTSQFGLVRVAELPRISPADVMSGVVTAGGIQSQSAPAPNIAPVVASAVASTAGSTTSGPSTTPAASDEIFSLIQKLADLHGKGILTDSEYETKKSELLSRL